MVVISRCRLLMSLSLPSIMSCKSAICFSYLAGLGSWNNAPILSTAFVVTSTATPFSLSVLISRRVCANSVSLSSSSVVRRWCYSLFARLVAVLGVQQYLPSASFAVLSGSRPARRFRSCGRYLAVILLCRYVFGFRSLDAASQSVFCHRFGIGGLVVFEFVPCHHIVGAQARTVFLCSVSSLSASGIPLPFQLGFPAFAPCDRHDGRVDMRCFLIQTQNCRYDVFLSEGLLQPAAGILGPSIQLPGLSDTLHIFGASGEHDMQVLTWFFPILRSSPALSSRCWIASMRLVTPLGNSTNSSLR